MRRLYAVGQGAGARRSRARCSEPRAHGGGVAASGLRALPLAVPWAGCRSNASGLPLRALSADGPTGRYPRTATCEGCSVWGARRFLRGVANESSYHEAMKRLCTVSPVDGSILVERALASDADLRELLRRATNARRGWRELQVAQRARWLDQWVDAMLSGGDEIAPELSWQMGRPVSQAPGELRGFEERARYMIRVAEESLAPIESEPASRLRRFIRREPLGTVLTVAPWNYPYLTAVNSVVPALMAGNVVILKHSAQTPLVAERFARAAEQVGLPEGVLQFVHCSHEQVEQLIRCPEVDYVAFTGSVDGGHAVQRAAASRFIAIGLELGGKDPAYVREDADVGWTVDNLVDGAFFNSGQSCCAVERIYVHERLFDDFVEAFVEAALSYRLGNPLDPQVNLGPMVRMQAAEHVREQVRQAVASGARSLISESRFDESRPNSPYLAPQVLVNVDHSMAVMREESFGPVIGIMPVRDDAHAVNLMNDSRFGLTASVWTRDTEIGAQLGSCVRTGTWFVNRCDYLDPSLAWTGVKDSGRGCSLSRLGYEALTRPQSFYVRRSP